MPPPPVHISPQIVGAQERNFEAVLLGSNFSSRLRVEPPPVVGAGRVSNRAAGLQSGYLNKQHFILLPLPLCEGDCYIVAAGILFKHDSGFNEVW